MRSLIAFWLIAVAVTAATGSVIALSDQGGAVGGVRVSPGAFHLPFPMFITLVVVSAFGPAIAAVAVTAWEAGIHGVRALLGQLLRWRAGVGWYALALGGPAVFTLLATLIWAAGTGRQPAHWFQLAAGFQLISLPIGPWGEEIGWRGFAQQRLQARLQWPLASLVVGVMWFGWHQWPFLTPAAPALNLAGLGTFFVYIVSAAVWIGWVYNGGGQRLPLGWAGHAGLNLVGPSSAPFGLVAAIFAAGAALAALIGGRQREAIARRCRANRYLNPRTRAGS